MIGDMRDIIERELQQHAAALRGLARDLVGPGAADDVVQETALQAMQTPPQRGGALGGWLAGIVRHVASRHRRSERRRVRREQNAARAEAQPADASVDDGDTLRFLTEAVLALPQPYRAAVFARYLKDLPPVAIAAQSGESIATIKTRLKRGLALLRERFDAREHERGGDWRGALAGAFGLEPAAVVAGITGVIVLMAKKMIGAAVVLLLGAGAWFLWPPTEPLVERQEERADSTAQVAAVPTPGPVVASPTERRELAPAPPVAPRRGGLRVRVLWADRSPAAGLSVDFQPETRLHGWFAARSVVADLVGLALCEDLALGPVKVSTRHGGAVQGEVVADSVTDLELSIPAGVELRGTVVDPSGSPVANATLLVGSAATRMQPVGRSNGYGAFALRSVEARLLLAAMAPGFQGSLAHRVGELPAREPLELRLSGPAGAVEGRVFDADGLPLAGAWVQAGVEQEPQPNRDTFLPEPLVQTGLDGLFRLDGFPLGHRWPVQCGATGHGVFRTSVLCTAHDTPFVEIRLQREVSLRGTVRRVDGAPRATLFVAIRDKTTPPEGIADQRPFWMTQQALVEADGTFAAYNLPPGRICASARDRDGASAFVEFEAAPGAELHWDAVLQKDGRIAGVVTDSEGNALAGWRVQAKPPAGATGPRDATTDAEGRFELTGCVAAPHRIQCFAAATAWHQPLATLRDVLPNGPALQVRVGTERLPTCSIVGRVLAFPKAPDAQFRVFAQGDHDGIVVVGPLPLGEAFRVDSLPAGTISLSVRCGVMQLQVGRYQLAPRQRLDLGDIRLPEPGRVAVSATDVDGRPLANAHVTLTRMGEYGLGGVSVKIEDGRGTTSIQPGSYLLQLGGLTTGFEHPVVEVRSGGSTELRLRQLPTWPRTFRYDATALELPQHCLARWHKGGMPVMQTTFRFWMEQPVEIDHALSAGDWQLELEVLGGSTHWFSFTVAAVAVADPIEICVPARVGR